MCEISLQISLWCSSPRNQCHSWWVLQVDLAFPWKSHVAQAPYLPSRYHWTHPHRLWAPQEDISWLSQPMVLQLNIYAVKTIERTWLTFSLDDQPPHHLTALRLNNLGANMNRYWAPPRRKQWVVNFPFRPFITPDLSTMLSKSASNPDWLILSPNFIFPVEAMAGKIKSAPSKGRATSFCWCKTQLRRCV